MMSPRFLFLSIFGSILLRGCASTQQKSQQTNCVVNSWASIDIPGSMLVATQTDSEDQVFRRTEVKATGVAGTIVEIEVTESKLSDKKMLPQPDLTKKYSIDFAIVEQTVQLREFSFTFWKELFLKDDSILSFRFNGNKETLNDEQ